MALLRKIAKGFLWSIGGLLLLASAALGYFYLSYHQAPPEAFARALDHPDKVVLYSLEPWGKLDASEIQIDSVDTFDKPEPVKTKEQQEADEKAAARDRFERDEAKGKFHSYKILGKTELTGEQAQQAASAFADAASGGWILGPLRFNCFDPRHGLRVTVEGHNYDFLLCYACDSMIFYRDWEQGGGQPASGSPAALNALLTAANIPLASVY